MRKYYERKEVKTMKYETPELTALTPAVNAIQTSNKPSQFAQDGSSTNEPSSAYADWED